MKDKVHRNIETHSPIDIRVEPFSAVRLESS